MKQRAGFNVTVKIVQDEEFYAQITFFQPEPDAESAVFAMGLELGNMDAFSDFRDRGFFFEIVDVAKVEEVR